MSIERSMMAGHTPWSEIRRKGAAMNEIRTTQSPAPGVSPAPELVTGVTTSPQESGHQFVCDLCRRSFESQQGLSMHRVRAHGMQPAYKKKKKRLMSNKAVSQKVEQLTLPKESVGLFALKAINFRTVVKAELRAT